MAAKRHCGSAARIRTLVQVSQPRVGIAQLRTQHQRTVFEPERHGAEALQRSTAAVAQGHALVHQQTQHRLTDEAGQAHAVYLRPPFLLAVTSMYQAGLRWLNSVVD